MADLALEIRDLWFWYEEGQPVLRHIDLSIDTGQFVAIVGANGSGKTTLAKHLNGLLRPRRGRVSVLGQDAQQQPVGALARHVGFLFQHPEHQIFAGTVREEIAFGPENLDLPADTVELCVRQALERFDLTSVAGLPPATLGYGLRRKVTLASLSAMDTPVLVLDEPTVGLDAPGRRDMLRWLAEQRVKGRTVLLVTHDMALVAELVDRVVALRQGGIVADGQPADLFRTSEVVQSASLAIPPVMALSRALEPSGMSGSSLTVDAFCQEYGALLEGKRS